MVDRRSALVPCLVGTTIFLCLAAGHGPSPAAEDGAKALSDDPLLQRAVTFTARAEPLASVLRTLSAAGGPQLRLGADLEKAGLKATAVVKEMPLHEAMGALAHLYQGEWKRDGEAYVMVPSALQGFQRDLQRIGDSDWFNYRASMALHAEKKRLPLDIQAALTPEQQAQYAGEGIAFRALPKELQDRVIQAAQGTEGVMRLALLRRAMPDVLQRSVLQIRTPKAGADGRHDPPWMSVTLWGDAIADIPWFTIVK